MQERGSKRRRVMLPLSRIILLLIVGGIFVFRGVAGLMVGTFSKTVTVVYILIGVLLMIGSGVGVMLRLRARKDGNIEEEPESRF